MAAAYSPLFSRLRQFIDDFPHEFFDGEPVEGGISVFVDHPRTSSFIETLVGLPIYEEGFAAAFEEAGKLDSLAAARRLRYCVGGNIADFARDVSILLAFLDPRTVKHWKSFGDRLAIEPSGQGKLKEYLRAGKYGESFELLFQTLEQKDPHAIYPTSCYRESEGLVVSADDGASVEAKMTQHTSTSIRIVDGVFEVENPILREMYQSLQRCVCLLDSNVDSLFGDEIRAYFEFHNIKLEVLVYRAMEVDKGAATVERMLGDFKRLEVARHEPVLIVGGGVLADTGGLACALYSRNTPYVMIGSSIVAGIDAGPSPRTCCDGFGYKNLFGAYHAPILSLTDRTLFRTLRAGWLRHGLAEIVKMAVVKDKVLFADLETAGASLISSRLGSVGVEPGSQFSQLSKKILNAAMRSYVEAEYGNLYETHQARPHAYGHTWSPGFEIASGLLHGHAVSVEMGFGALLSHREGWIDDDSLERILSLISNLELSLWHDILLDKDLLWSAQEKIIAKRGGHLAAPLPRFEIGRCGYLDRLDQSELFSALREYEEICRGRVNHGIGIEPLCSDVGLEDPSTVGTSPIAESHGAIGQPSLLTAES